MKNNQLIPGEPLREGVDLIADKKTGALIVVGSSSKLDKISSGGINLSNCKFTPEMLCELAKMDGAIIVDENVDTILKANVHLNPSDLIETSQTGTRHRTAQRVSVETELDVIAVSDESGIIKVFSNNEVNELEESSMILGRVNESLQSIDRTRRRFDDALIELGELEIDIFIRTGGDMRLSNFLLPNIGYSELFFTEKLWPEFNSEDFQEILKEFKVRQRRFGK